MGQKIGRKKKGPCELTIGRAAQQRNYYDDESANATGNGGQMRNEWTRLTEDCRRMHTERRIPKKSSENQTPFPRSKFDPATGVRKRVKEKFCHISIRLFHPHFKFVTCIRSATVTSTKKITNTKSSLQKKSVTVRPQRLDRRPRRLWNVAHPRSFLDAGLRPHIPSSVWVVLWSPN